MVLNASAPQTQEVTMIEWEPQPGAMFLVDTRAAIGYIVNEDGTYASIPVVLGQHKTVHYLGRSYNATTPEATWIVREIDTQSDRITFGRKGTFLRLFRDGTVYTSYGIHSYAYIDEFLKNGDHYRSMGCILVREEVLEKLEQAYKLNGKSLQVVTVYGLDHPTL